MPGFKQHFFQDLAPKANENSDMISPGVVSIPSVWIDSQASAGTSWTITTSSSDSLTMDATAIWDNQISYAHPLSVQIGNGEECHFTHDGDFVFPAGRVNLVSGLVDLDVEELDEASNSFWESLRAVARTMQPYVSGIGGTLNVEATSISGDGTEGSDREEDRDDAADDPSPSE